jgi:two-component system, chemotaxis family, response regulator Rcp1
MNDEVTVSRQVTILLVEDNPADINMIEETLEETNFDCSLQVVNDGEAALDFLQRQGRFADAPRPDLILLDIGLPRKNGLEVLSEVKDDPALRRIPVIVLTTSKAEEDVLKSYDLHANSYISKPVHLEGFLEVMKSIQLFWLTTVKLPSR